MSIGTGIYDTAQARRQVIKINAAAISSTGKDKRSKYSYYFNKPKQHKSKDAAEKREKRQLKKEAKNAFTLDTSKPLNELLAYSAKGYSHR